MVSSEPSDSGEAMYKIFFLCQCSLSLTPPLFIGLSSPKTLSPHKKRKNQVSGRILIPKKKNKLRIRQLFLCASYCSKKSSVDHFIFLGLQASFSKRLSSTILKEYSS